MSYKIGSIAISKKSDLEQFDTHTLLSTFNRETKRETKKFASRSKGVEQLWKVIQSKTADGKPPAAKKEVKKDSVKKSPSKKADSNCRFLFNFSADDKIKPHREGSKGRATVVRMLSEDEGATFEEIRKATGWSEKDAYEGIRLVHYALGWGMKTNPETGKITIFRKK